VSVAEIVPREEFERTPPHDLAAEQCVLGGMMLSKDAISDVLEVIRPSDHYRPAHQIVHEAILDLYGRGEPADAVTVAAELTKRGAIAKVGGAPYLHTLIASVPTAANAGYYARIVRERAILRRLVEVGTRIVQLGYAGDADADELVDRAQAEVYGVTERRVSEDFLPLSEIMPGALLEIEAIGSRGGVLTGVPTGFTDLDSLTNGLHPGQMIVIAARPALGKALALDTPLPTPAGWTTMRDVRVGDYLLGADGRPTRVTAATEVMHGRPCFDVEFDDATVITADAEHQWQVTAPAAGGHAGSAGPHATASQPGGALAGAARQSGGCGTVAATDLAVARRAASGFGLGMLVPAAGGIPPHLARYRGGGSGPGAQSGRRLPAHRPLPTPHPRRSGQAQQPDSAAAGIIRTTGELAAAMSVRAGRTRYAVPVAAALQLPDARLALAPYVLGARIGGSINMAARFSHADRDVLGALGALSDQHIPAVYLRASEHQRRELLAGLLDTGGHVSRDGSVQFPAANRRLAEDVQELVLSLGYRCGLTERTIRPAVGESSTGCTVTFAGEEVSRLADNRVTDAQRQPERVNSPLTQRAVTAVRAVPSVPVRCVQVDSSDHLYLAGRAMIPTHNSTLALDFARATSIKHGLASVIFSLEMSRNEITMRLLSAEARIPLHLMRTGQLGEDDWTRLARRMSEVAQAPLFIDDSPNMSMMEIRAKCRRLKQQHDLRLVIIDYLQLMSSPKKVENRQQEVSEMSRSLKLLAKELNVPVIAVAQLNRGPEQRTDKRPMLSDLRESGSIEQDSDVVILLHREDAYERESPRAGEADFIVAKHRNGPTATITVAFQGHYSRFVDMAPI
jgi:replicative DNA helicase